MTMASARTCSDAAAPQACACGAPGPRPPPMCQHFTSMGSRDAARRSRLTVPMTSAAVGGASPCSSGLSLRSSAQAHRQAGHKAAPGAAPSSSHAGRQAPQPVPGAAARARARSHHGRPPRLAARDTGPAGAQGQVRAQATSPGPRGPCARRRPMRSSCPPGARARRTGEPVGRQAVLARVDGGRVQRLAGHRVALAAALGHRARHALPGQAELDEVALRVAPHRRHAAAADVRRDGVPDAAVQRHPLHKQLLLVRCPGLDHRACARRGRPAGVAPRMGRGAREPVAGPTATMVDPPLQAGHGRVQTARRRRTAACRHSQQCRRAAARPAAAG